MVDMGMDVMGPARGRKAVSAGRPQGERSGPTSGSQSPDTMMVEGPDGIMRPGKRAPATKRAD